VIINVDNHSPDGTKEAFLNTSTAAPKMYISYDQNAFWTQDQTAHRRRLRFFRKAGGCFAFTIKWKQQKPKNVKIISKTSTECLKRNGDIS